MQLKDFIQTPDRIDWLWEGFLARGALTMLTAQWKTGKTTLLSRLLPKFEKGGHFLGRRVDPALRQRGHPEGRRALTRYRRGAELRDA